MRHNTINNLFIIKLNLHQEGYFVTIIHYYLLRNSFIPLRTILKNSVAYKYAT